MTKLFIVLLAEHQSSNDACQTFAISTISLQVTDVLVTLLWSTGRFGRLFFGFRRLLSTRLTTNLTLSEVMIPCFIHCPKSA